MVRFVITDCLLAMMDSRPPEFVTGRGCEVMVGCTHGLSPNENYVANNSLEPPTTLVDPPAPARVPTGRHDTSPALQRRVEFGIAKVPQGRLNGRHVLR